MHNYSLRSILAFTVPSITALLGLIWYFGRKKREDGDDAAGKGSGDTSGQLQSDTKNVSRTETSATAGEMVGSKVTKESSGINRTDENIQGGVQLLSSTDEKSVKTIKPEEETKLSAEKLSSNTSVSSSRSAKVQVSQGHAHSDICAKVNCSGDASQNISLESTRALNFRSPTKPEDPSAVGKDMETSDSGDRVSARRANQVCVGAAQKSGGDGNISLSQKSGGDGNISLSQKSGGDGIVSLSGNISASDIKTHTSETAMELDLAKTETNSPGRRASNLTMAVMPREFKGQEERVAVTETFSHTAVPLSLSAEKPQSTHVSTRSTESQKLSSDLSECDMVMSDANVLLVEPVVCEDMAESEVNSTQTDVQSDLGDVQLAASNSSDQFTLNNTVIEVEQSVSPAMSAVHHGTKQEAVVSRGDIAVETVTATYEENQTTLEDLVLLTEGCRVGDEVVVQTEVSTAHSTPGLSQANDGGSQKVDSESAASSDSRHTHQQSFNSDSVGDVALATRIKTGSVDSETPSVLLDSARDATSVQTIEQGSSVSKQEEHAQDSTSDAHKTVDSLDKHGDTTHDKYSDKSKAMGDSNSTKSKSYTYDEKWSKSKSEASRSRRDGGDDITDQLRGTDEEAAVHPAVVANGRVADVGSPGCDTHSEESNDSGRGGSVGDNLVALSAGELVHYEFNFPSDLCGRLIGRGGRNIHYIKEESGATVALASNPFTPEYQICRVQGVQAEVDKALMMIRKKFPIARYPQLDMTPIGPPAPTPIIIPEVMQLNLPEGVSVDVVVSAIVNAGHIFVQQPTHPTFPSLERLQHFMNTCYIDQIVPELPRPVEGGVICASESEGQWYRVQVMQVYEKDDACDIKYVDYGGYACVPLMSLRQIRSDFMTLPFQAVECYLANITPLQDEEYFSEKASEQLAELTTSKVLQGQVIVRGDDSVPYVHLYQVSGHSVLLINREMVNREVVRWIEIL